MRKAFPMFLLALLFSATLVRAGMLEDVMKKAGMSQSGGADESTTAAGLKEALSIGAKNAVRLVSRKDGYFGNQAIRIQMPGKIRQAANVLGKMGYQKQVDAFVLSMNRAAEKAAPRAKAIFVDAIKGMSISDAKKILGGGDTAATEYFKEKTSARLYDEFKPVISSSMDQVGTTRAYKEMMGKYEAVPFVPKQSLDLDHYVTNKALNGLFYMVGQEEKKIRTDPAARVTDLLRKVFGK
ncbi:MAG: DUF4197 domain-containing protein [Actinomycetota bacterium]|nr:DUF4197 domain-containing protein [Actinomycetota bacterium]